MKILFINNKDERCGIADYGRRLLKILQKEFDITESEQTGRDINYDGYDIALYNYCHATLPDVNSSNRKVKHIALYHEAHKNFEPDVWINVTDLPRPIDESICPQIWHHEKPVIGSFGFGFPDKDFPRIAWLVKSQFPDGAILKLNMTYAHYGDDDGSMARREADKVREIIAGTNIELHITHEFLNEERMLNFLSMNDINLFLYKNSHGRGISSSIDYALSAKRPIGISQSEMFRHLPREILVDFNSIPDLIAQGIEPLKKVYEENSNQKLVEAFKKHLNG